METERSLDTLGELYTQYMSEREDCQVLSNDNAFIVYQIYENTLIVKELFSKKDARAQGFAKALYLEVLETAKKAGCTLLSCTVHLRANGSANAFEIFYAHGLRPVRAENNIIILAKEI